MLKATILALTLILAVTIGTAFAGDCSNENFFGTYTRVDPATDVFGDGTVNHQYIYQLVLTSGGSVYQYWTGLPDYQLTFGSGTPWVGSWECRSDGKLIVTVLTSTFAPVGPDEHIASPDLTLAGYYRSTYLFKINGRNKMTRIQARTRTYAPDQDPTDPAGGTLSNLSTTQITYNRLLASDADLLAP